MSSQIDVIEWVIHPVSMPGVRKNCSKCRKKTNFVSSGKFRVNANGGLVDVWLIYRCKTCGTSWNLTIYERVSPGKLSRDEFERFQMNDADAAAEYACRKDILSRNKAEALWNEVEYCVGAAGEQWNAASVLNGESGVIIHIQNPSGIPVRLDKLLKEQLACSSRELKELEDNGRLHISPDTIPLNGKCSAELRVEIS